MKLTIDISDKDFNKLLMQAVKEHLDTELTRPPNIKAIRDGTIEYLCKYNLYEFIKLIKSG